MDEAYKCEDDNRDEPHEIAVRIISEWLNAYEDLPPDLQAVGTTVE